MAKKAKDKQKPHDKTPGLLARVTGWASAAGSRLTRAQWLTVLGVIVLVAGVRWGLGRLEGRVRRIEACNPQPRIQLVELPKWATDEGWAPRLTAAVSIDDTYAWNDEALLDRVADDFRASGWVKEIRALRKQGDGTIQVACDFYRPVGMVQTPEGYIPVDIEGVRLPEVYDRLSPGWIMISGVTGPLPPVGQRWASDELRAGVELTALLFNQPWASAISAIDVSNYDPQRRDARRHPIVLKTKQGMQIRWGSAPGEEIAEPLPAEKLRVIEQQLRAGTMRAWIDVSVFSHKVIGPQAGHPDLLLAGGVNR